MSLIFGTDTSRFWLNVEPGRTDDECWEWTGAVNRIGYGRFGIDGEVDGAHRVAYRLEVGPIPTDSHVHHLCENRRCVNPRHLEALTYKKHRATHGLAGAALTHSRATHCANGHPFDDSRGGRGCRICHNEAVRRHNAANPEKKNESRRRWRQRRRAAGLPYT